MLTDTEIHQAYERGLKKTEDSNQAIHYGLKEVAMAAREDALKETRLRAEFNTHVANYDLESAIKSIFPCNPNEDIEELIEVFFQFYFYTQK